MNYAKKILQTILISFMLIMMTSFASASYVNKTYKDFDTFARTSIGNSEGLGVTYTGYTTTAIISNQKANISGTSNIGLTWDYGATGWNNATKWFKIRTATGATWVMRGNSPSYDAPCMFKKMTNDTIAYMYTGNDITVPDIDWTSTGVQAGNNVDYWYVTWVDSVNDKCNMYVYDANGVNLWNVTNLVPIEAVEGVRHWQWLYHTSLGASTDAQMDEWYICEGLDLNCYPKNTPVGLNYSQLPYDYINATYPDYFDLNGIKPKNGDLLSDFGWASSAGNIFYKYPTDGYPTTIRLCGGGTYGATTNVGSHSITNSTIEILFYDTGVNARQIFVADNGVDQVAIGIKEGESNYFTFGPVFNDWQNTGVAKSVGWHSLKIYYNISNNANYYIDDAFVGGKTNVDNPVTTFRLVNEGTASQCGYWGYILWYLGNETPKEPKENLFNDVFSDSSYDYTMWHYACEDSAGCGPSSWDVFTETTGGFYTNKTGAGDAQFGLVSPARMNLSQKFDVSLSVLQVNGEKDVLGIVGICNGTMQNSTYMPGSTGGCFRWGAGATSSFMTSACTFTEGTTYNISVRTSNTGGFYMMVSNTSNGVTDICQPWIRNPTISDYANNYFPAVSWRARGGSQPQLSMKVSYAGMNDLLGQLGPIIAPPPVINSLYVTPSYPQTYDNLSCNFNVNSTVDVNVSVSWYKNIVGEVLADNYPVENADMGSSIWSPGGILYMGESFTGNGGTLSKVTVYLRRYDSGSIGNATIKIYAHNGTYGVDGVPTGSALATSDTVLDISPLSWTVYNPFNFTFSGAGAITLTNGMHYVLVVEVPDISGELLVRSDSTSTYDGNSAYSYDGSSWTAYAPDLIFYVYENIEYENIITLPINTYDYTYINATPNILYTTTVGTGSVPSSALQNDTAWKCTLDANNGLHTYSNSTNVSVHPLVVTLYSPTSNITSSTPLNVSFMAHDLDGNIKCRVDTGDSSLSTTKSDYINGTYPSYWEFNGDKPNEGDLLSTYGWTNVDSDDKYENYAFNGSTLLALKLCGGGTYTASYSLGSHSVTDTTIEILFYDTGLNKEQVFVADTFSEQVGIGVRENQANYMYLGPTSNDWTSTGITKSVDTHIYKIYFNSTGDATYYIDGVYAGSRENPDDPISNFKLVVASTSSSDCGYFGYALWYTGTVAPFSFTSVTSDVLSNISKSFTTEGAHLWNLQCTANYGNTYQSNTYSYLYDGIPPIVNQLYVSPTYPHTYDDLNCSFSVTESLPFNVSVSWYENSILSVGEDITEGFSCTPASAWDDEGLSYRGFQIYGINQTTQIKDITLVGSCAATRCLIFNQSGTVFTLMANISKVGNVCNFTSLNINLPTGNTYNYSVVVSGEGVVVSMPYCSCGGGCLPTQNAYFNTSGGWATTANYNLAGGYVDTTYLHCIDSITTGGIANYQPVHTYDYTYENAVSGQLYTTTVGTGSVPSSALTNYTDWKCAITSKSPLWTVTNQSSQVSLHPLENLVIYSPANATVSNQQLQVNMSIRDDDEGIQCYLNNPVTQISYFDYDTFTRANNNNPGSSERQSTAYTTFGGTFAVIDSNTAYMSGNSNIGLTWYQGTAFVSATRWFKIKTAVGTTWAIRGNTPMLDAPCWFRIMVNGTIGYTHESNDVSIPDTSLTSTGIQVENSTYFWYGIFTDSNTEKCNMYVSDINGNNLWSAIGLTANEPVDPITQWQWLYYTGFPSNPGANARMDEWYFCNSLCSIPTPSNAVNVSSNTLTTLYYNYTSDGVYNWNLTCTAQGDTLRSGNYQYTYDGVPPVINELSASPQYPTTSNDLTCHFNISDDLNIYNATVSWYQNDIEVHTYDYTYTNVVSGDRYSTTIGTGSVPSSALTNDTSWKCNLNVKDGWNIYQNSSQVNIYPLQVTLYSPANETISTQPLNVSFMAHDLDGGINCQLNSTTPFAFFSDSIVNDSNWIDAYNIHDNDYTTSGTHSGFGHMDFYYTKPLRDGTFIRMKLNAVYDIPYPSYCYHNTTHVRLGMAQDTSGAVLFCYDNVSAYHQFGEYPAYLFGLNIYEIQMMSNVFNLSSVTSDVISSLGYNFATDGTYTWDLSCTADYGESYQSNQYTYIYDGSPPTINELFVTPQYPTTDNNLDCNFNTTDSNIAIYNATVSWYMNDTEVHTYDYTYTSLTNGLRYTTTVGTGSVPSSVLLNDTTWKCNLHLQDGWDITQNSSSVGPYPLSVTLYSPTTNMTSSQPLNVSFMAHDLDDGIQCSIITNEPSNTTINLTSDVVSNISHTFAVDGLYTWYLDCTSINNEEYVGESYTYGSDATPPVVNYVNVVPTYPKTEDDLNCTFMVTDTYPAFDVQVEWYKSIDNITFASYGTPYVFTTVSSGVPYTTGIGTGSIPSNEVSNYTNWICGVSVSGIWGVKQNSTQANVYPLENLTITSPACLVYSTDPLIVIGSVIDYDDNIACNLNTQDGVISSAAPASGETFVLGVSGNAAFSYNLSYLNYSGSEATGRIAFAPNTSHSMDVCLQNSSNQDIIGSCKTYTSGLYGYRYNILPNMTDYNEYFNTSNVSENTVDESQNNIASMPIVVYENFENNYSEDSTRWNRTSSIMSTGSMSHGNLDDYWSTSENHGFCDWCSPKGCGMWKRLTNTEIDFTKITWFETKWWTSLYRWGPTSMDATINLCHYDNDGICAVMQTRGGGSPTNVEQHNVTFWRTNTDSNTWHVLEDGVEVTTTSTASLNSSKAWRIQFFGSIYCSADGSYQQNFNEQIFNVKIGGASIESSDYNESYAPTGNVRSDIIFNTANSITSAYLGANDYTPSGTSIAYYLSNNNGTNWYSATKDAQLVFLTLGGNLAWKAIMNTTNSNITPIVNNVRIYNKATTNELNSSYATLLETNSVNMSMIKNGQYRFKFEWDRIQYAEVNDTSLNGNFKDVSTTTDYTTYFNYNSIPGSSTETISTNVQASGLLEWITDYSYPDTDGNYYWNVSCTSTGGTTLYSPVCLYIYDTTGPTMYNDTMIANNASNFPQIGDTLQMSIVVYDLNNVSTCTLYINNTGTFTNKSTYVINSQNSTVQMSWLVPETVLAANSRLAWYASCTDTVGSTDSSALYLFRVVDVVEPEISLLSSTFNTDGTSVISSYGNDVTFGLNYSDYNLFQAMVNVTCDKNGTIYYWEILDINTSSYLKTDTIDLLDYPAQKCNFTTQSSDDHTKKMTKAYDASNVDKGLKFKTTEGINVWVTTNDAQFKTTANTKMTDRQKIKFTFKDSQISRIYYVKSNMPLYYQNDGRYNAHFVAWDNANKKGNWIDFNSKEKYDYSVEKLNNYEYMVTVSSKDGKKLKEMEFESIGGTNINEMSWSFYIGATVNATAWNLYDNGTINGFSINMNKVSGGTPWQNLTFNSTDYQENLANISNGTYAVTFLPTNFFNQSYTWEIANSLEQKPMYSYQSVLNVIVRNVKSGVNMTNLNLTAYNMNTSYTTKQYTTSYVTTFYLNASNYNVTMEKADYSADPYLTTLSPYENKTIIMQVAYYTQFRFIDENTLEPFNLSSPDSVRFILNCPDYTRETLIVNESQKFFIDCDYTKLRFVLQYGTVSYARTFIKPYEDALNMSVYLIDLLTTDAVELSFRLDDLLADYVNPRIYITKMIDDNSTQIHADYTDLENKVVAMLIKYHEYTITVYSDNNPPFVLGVINADAAGSKALSLYGIGLVPTTTAGYYNNVYQTAYEANATGSNFLVYIYNDTATATEWVRVQINENDENGASILDTYLYNQSSFYGIQNITTQINTETPVLLRMTINSAGETHQWGKLFNLIGRRLPQAIQNLNQHLSPNFMSWFFMILITIVGLYSSASTANYMPLVLVAIAFAANIFFGFATTGWVAFVAILATILIFTILSNMRKGT